MSGELRELAGRLVVGLAGDELAAAERRWLAHWRPAGVILFARNCRTPGQWRRLLADARDVLPPGAECCADHEGGPVSFLQNAAGRPPAARTLGGLDDVGLTRRVHEETGRRVQSLGLDRVLAPCCDVLREARNPVIGARSFGAEPELVARHAAAAMAGLAAAGLRGCAKHWPGHGATLADTHEAAAAPLAGGGVARGGDDRPFGAVLAAGADAVMVGHLPAVVGGLPLTLDGPRLAALRRELGGGVLLYSDDVSMGALRAPLAARGVAAPDGRREGLVDPADLTAAWLLAVAAAGCDRLLLRGIPWRALPLPPDGAEPPAPAASWPQLRPADLDLAQTGPDAEVYAEARRRAAAPVHLRHGDARLLWFDATGQDRLGSAQRLQTAVRAWWPQAVRVAAGAPPGGGELSGGSHDALLVTCHRPLTAGQAHWLQGATAGGGTALAAGHPSLAGDLQRLLGPRWRVDALYDCARPDLAVLGADAI